MTIEHDVFVSHSWHSKDIDVTKRIVSDMKEFGIAVWCDYDVLKGGDPIWAIIAHAIRYSSNFLIIVSEKSLQSSGVQQELYWAQECKVRFGMRVVPLVIEPCGSKFSDNLLLSSVLYIELNNSEEGYADALSKLRESFKPVESHIPTRLLEDDIIEAETFRINSFKQGLIKSERFALPENIAICPSCGHSNILQGYVVLWQAVKHGNRGYIACSKCGEYALEPRSRKPYNNISADDIDKIIVLANQIRNYIR